MIKVRCLNFYNLEVMGLDNPIISFSVKCNKENIKVRETSHFENKLYITLDNEIILGNHYQLEIDNQIL